VQAAYKQIKAQKVPKALTTAAAEAAQEGWPTPMAPSAQTLVAKKQN
jgi:hypothetical protein